MTFRYSVDRHSNDIYRLLTIVTMNYKIWLSTVNISFSYEHGRSLLSGSGFFFSKQPLHWHPCMPFLTFCPLTAGRRWTLFSKTPCTYKLKRQFLQNEAWRYELIWTVEVSPWYLTHNVPCYERTILIWLHKCLIHTFKFKFKFSISSSLAYIHYLETCLYRPPNGIFFCLLKLI